MLLRNEVSFQNNNSNIFCVNLYIDNIESECLFLKLPVWTPGSYLVREFAKNMDYILEYDTQKRLKKINKNTWKVEVNQRKSIHLSYTLYANEWSVRTNHCNHEHAFINGAATFLHIEGFEHIPISIDIVPPKNWSVITSNLPSINNNSFQLQAQNIDELYDSFIEIGNQNTYHFEVAETQYELAIFGHHEAVIPSLIDDLKKIISIQKNIFGNIGLQKYTFLIHHSLNGFGGLEHSNGSVNHLPSHYYSDRKKYQQAISLLAHEHFHLWNVKRIKPKEFMSFNYNEENYTQLLWFFEGITSYYDDLTCYRAGVFSLEEYISIIENLINEVENNPGNDVQTLAESSFDAWIKYYRQNENSINTEVSYYKKGAVIALLLDVYLIYYSHAKYCLDDVMLLLYEESKKADYGGLTKEKIIETLNHLARYDWISFYENYIENTVELPIKKALDSIGVQTYVENKDGIYLGLFLYQQNNQYYIKQLDKNYGAYQSALQVQDMMVAIDGKKFENNLDDTLKQKQVGEIVTFSVWRDGQSKEIEVKLTKDNRKNYTITILQPSSETAFLDKWLCCKST